MEDQLSGKFYLFHQLRVFSVVCGPCLVGPIYQCLWAKQMDLHLTLKPNQRTGSTSRWSMIYCKRSAAETIALLLGLPVTNEIEGKRAETEVNHGLIVMKKKRTMDHAAARGSDHPDPPSRH